MYGAEAYNREPATTTNHVRPAANVDTYHILVVASDPNATRRYLPALEAAPDLCNVQLSVRHVPSTGAAQLYITSHSCDLVIVTASAEQELAFKFVEVIYQVYPEIPVIMLYSSDVRSAQLAPLVRLGVKVARHPVRPDLLARMVAEALKIVLPPRPDETLLPDESATAELEPAQQVPTTHRVLRDLSRATRASLVVCTDNLGNIIAQYGHVAEFEIASLATLIAGSFVNMVEMGRMLGDENTVHFNILEGTLFDVYSVNVGQDRLLSIFLEKTYVQPRVGFIWLALKRTAETLRGCTADGDGAHEIADSFAQSFSNTLDDIFGRDGSD